MATSRLVPVGAIVQGAGSVGGGFARLLAADGHRVIGLSDLYGAYYDPAGLDEETLLAWRKAHADLRDAPGSFQRISNEELILKPCDVLAPCAVANVVNSHNAEDIQVCHPASRKLSARVGAPAERLSTLPTTRVSRGLVPVMIATWEGTVTLVVE